MNDRMIKRVAALLRPVPNFPKPGILFWDLQPVLRDPQAVQGILSSIAAQWQNERIDVIAGFDARGFLIGQALALAMGLPFEQIRKKGKLPPPVVSESYELEYGEATLEMEDTGFIASKRVLLVDDLLATGGTGEAGAKLVERLGGIVVGFAYITELPALGGRAKLLKYRVESLISIIDDTLYTNAAYCVDMFVTDKDTGDLLLCRRLTGPQGIAMLGGHIESESAVAAAIREFLEETGIETTANDWVYTKHTLAAAGRDPRGMKVSLVLQASVSIKGRRPEMDKNGQPKHEFVVVQPGLDSLPEKSEFTLGHGPTVNTLWTKKLLGQLTAAE